MGFEDFRRRRPKRFSPDEIALTIMKSDRLLLSPTAYEVLGRPERVQLAFDTSLRIIGIRAAKPGDPYPQRILPGRQISAVTFCRYFQIPTTETRRYSGEWRDYQLIFPLEPSREELGEAETEGE